MKKIKRILAWIGIVVLLGLYAASIVTAVLATPNSVQMFRASLIATLVVPVMLYVVMFIFRLIHPEEMAEMPMEDMAENEKKINKTGEEKIE